MKCIFVDAHVTLEKRRTQYMSTTAWFDWIEMGLKEIKGDGGGWRCSQRLEKSHFINWKTRRTTTTVDNGGSQGEMEGTKEREKKKEKPRTNDTASIRASYSSRLTSQHPYFPDKPMTSPYSCVPSFNFSFFTFNLLLLSKFWICLKAVSELTWMEKWPDPQSRWILLSCQGIS